MEREFEWDTAKEAANRVKHGLGFKLACRAFLDPHAVTRRDERRDYGESRFITAGKVEGRLLVIVHTLRGRTIRIISARKANSRERKHHGDGPCDA